ncbi:hypothetical protein Tco_0472510 [Tanacetum coccineum]
MTMDWYTKNALWVYWKRGDEEELSDLEEENLNDNEVAKIFRIETDIFHFETPLYHFVSKMDVLNGQLVIGRRESIEMEVIYWGRDSLQEL